MTFIQFFSLSIVNLAIIIFIIRRWSIASAEGLCMAYLGIAVLSDNVELIFHYFASLGVLPLGHREVAFRIYPTEMQIFGLLTLIAGLWIVGGSPASGARELDDIALVRLRHLGIAIAIIGLILTSVALYLVGALSSANFYAALNSFRDEALPFGGFWYRGADIAVFGMALTLPSLQGKPRRFFAALSAMMFVSFFLRTNKGGLEEPILWGAIVLFAYNRKFLQTLLNGKTIVLAMLIAFLGVGGKLWFLPRVMGRSPSQRSSLVQLVKVAAAGTSVRWGDDGLYRGYCQFVNTLPDNRGLFDGAKVGVYSLTSWIPRWLYADKPDHPFRGLGFAIYSDFHTYPDETPAPMLIGSAMADDGWISLLVYMFFAGLFLGCFRRFATTESTSLFRHCGYMFFVLFGGFSAEEGTLGLIYTMLLAYGVVAAASLLLGVKDLVTVATPVRTRAVAADENVPTEFAE
jgi:hypothetical protein